MTGTPKGDEAAIVRPPSVIHGRSIGRLTVVTSVRGVVDRLVAEGASEQTLLEAIRHESPEIADVVESTERPQGWTAYQWVMVILAVYMAVLATYGAVRSGDSQPSAAEIAEIVKETFASLPGSSGGSGVESSSGGSPTAK